MSKSNKVLYYTSKNTQKTKYKKDKNMKTIKNLLFWIFFIPVFAVYVIAYLIQWVGYLLAFIPCIFKPNNLPSKPKFGV